MKKRTRNNMRKLSTKVIAFVIVFTLALSSLMGVPIEVFAASGQTLSTILLPSSLEFVATLTGDNNSFVSNGITKDGITTFNFDVPLGTYRLTISADGCTHYIVSSFVLGKDQLPGIIQIYQGDINGDGIINAKDNAVIAEAFGKREGDSGYYSAADFNGDKIINAKDKAIISESFTKRDTIVTKSTDIDTDGDGLYDSVENYLGTSITCTDTDNDGLTDYFEVMLSATDPLKKDTNNNGVLDCDEDLDNDGLTNIQEYEYQTDPAIVDTDSDGLSDKEEIEKYHTNPVIEDTDNDGVSDGKEIEFGTNPLLKQEQFNVIVSSDEEDAVKASVKVKLDGKQVETLNVSKVHNDSIFPSNMPGYLGGAYNFSVDGNFDSAVVRFEFDPDLYSREDFDPTIYYFNEKKQALEALETTVNGNTASATVEHFSIYLLIDRSLFEKSFNWIDVWNTDEKYSKLEIVFVIDDSGSMGPQGSNNDPQNLRLSVAQELIDSLPADSKIGVVAFDEYSVNLTQTLTTDKQLAKSFLSTNYFKSDGYNTYMYDGINSGLGLFEDSGEDVLKIIVVLSDGCAEDTDLHSATIQSAVESNVKLYTIGLGSSNSLQSYFNSVLKPIAEETNGSFYLANNALELKDIYKAIGRKIDIETDSDNDGIPDYFEDNLILYNGTTITLDKASPDTDGDGIIDGQEIQLTYKYNEEKTKVMVTAKMKSNPTQKDTDNDGFEDDIDPTPLEPICYKSFDHYKNAKYGKDKATLTIYIDQPYDNSRKVINFDDENEYVGHTYVGIDYNSTAKYAGFWPLNGYGTKRAIKRESVDGQILMNGSRYLTDGKHDNVFEEIDYNEKNHKWDVAYTYEIDSSDVGNMVLFSKNYKYQYNMVSNNCTTFAVNSLNDFGVSPKIYPHRWTYEGILNIVAGTFYGYSPADAGQDIRSNYTNYIYYGDYTLVDKKHSVVKGVYDAGYTGFSEIFYSSLRW